MGRRAEANDATTSPRTLLAELVDTVSRIVTADRRPVTPDSRLFADLALDSFELMELATAIEDRTGKSFGLGDIARTVQGALSESDFVGLDGRLTDTGWSQARSVMPQIPADLAAGSRYPINVVGHFSLRNLADLLESGDQVGTESAW
jgi:acyl carrier protein